MTPWPSFREALSFWLKLGFISFGGPAGQIAIMHEYLVDKKKWISESRFLHALNYCMLLPGPEAQQLAIYTGWLLHGIRGGLVAGILFVLPSMFILILLSVIYVTLGSIPWVAALFYGLKPAVVAIVLLALLKIGKRSLKHFVHFILATLSFIAIFFFKISFPIIMVVTVVISIALYFFSPIFKNVTSKNSTISDADEKEYVINNIDRSKWAELNPRQLLRITVIALLLWAIPLTSIYASSMDISFWDSLIKFFSKAALVTFGGAYAVLPYVAQVAVEQFHWLEKVQMIDGLALGETTPGPLVMVLSFVGFMAGYNHFDHSIWFGVLALIITTYYTFLPCFLFIFVGAPIIERTQKNQNTKNILELISSSVVGVILNLAVYLGITILFPGKVIMSDLDFISLAWIIISLIMLYRFKWNIIAWIGISALYGLLIHFIQLY